MIIISYFKTYIILILISLLKVKSNVSNDNLLNKDCNNNFDYNNKFNKFYFSFPREGELVLAKDCVDNDCYIEFIVFGLMGFLYEPNMECNNAIKNYTISGYIGNYNIFQNYYNEKIIKGFHFNEKLRYKIPRNILLPTIQVHLKFQFHDSNDYSSITVNLVIITDIQADKLVNHTIDNNNQMINNNVESLDFVEIGTSNFDTCGYAAQHVIDNKIEYQNHFLGIEFDINTLSGLSIEPIQQYLNQLPNYKNVIKINAAITTTPTHPSIYYIPDYLISLNPAVSSTTASSNDNNFLFGMNMIDSIHPSLIKLLNNTITPLPMSIIKKDLVKGFTVDNIWSKYIINKSIKFVKIDTEGLDVQIVNNILDYYENKKYNNSNLPNVIFFEIFFEGKFVQDSRILLSRLKQLNYHVHYDDFNCVAILCSSSIYDIKIAEGLAYPDDIRIESVVRSCPQFEVLEFAIDSNGE
jgi:hypothetical protein